MYTKSDLLADIKNMGVNPQGALLIHSSMKAIGPVEGGADTVLDAWCQYMGEGLLIFPTHTWKYIGQGKEQTVFDSRTLPSCVGILPELFRHRPGVVRSLHPTHSVAALGKGAAAYTAGEEQAHSPCPRDGCWGRLLDLDADILFLGCTLRSNTFIHGVEEWEGIPNRLTEETRPITIIGPQGEEYRTDARFHYCPAGDVSENYDKLEKPFLKHGAIWYGTFGDAKCIIGNARKMRATACALLEKNPDLFLDAQAVPEEWYGQLQIPPV